MDRTFSITTIGCKLNQFDSEEIREALARDGWRHREPAERPAVFIINSCAVTARSDARCRNAVRRTRRAAPDAFIVVTGCSAETQPESLAAMKEIDLVLGNRDKGSIPAILDRAAGGGGAAELAGIAGGPARAVPIERFSGHARAFIKVQDGCDAACAYCIVPRARGRARSVPLADVLAQVVTLGGNGYREIVLTGVHIGSYGADLDPPATLASLVESILDRTDIPRIRLGSVEPTEVTPRLLALLGSTDRLAPHLHIPLQSGDDAVLEAMRRPYRAADFRDRIEAVVRARPGAAIGTDLIVGFPGETEDRFERTHALVRDLPISYFHVFSFSPRPFTAAASLPGRPGPATAKDRSARLIALGETKWRAFLESQVGTVQPSIIEGSASGRASRASALTGTYCEVRVRAGSMAPGSLVPVRVDRCRRGVLHGTVLPENGGEGGRA